MAAPGIKVTKSVATKIMRRRRIDSFFPKLITRINFDMWPGVITCHLSAKKWFSAFLECLAQGYRRGAVKDKNLIAIFSGLVHISTLKRFIKCLTRATISAQTVPPIGLEPTFRRL